MERVKELDGIRGIAAISVVLSHLASQSAYHFLNNDLVLPFSFGFGRYGVDIFFMLSGFVIFLSLERKNSLLDFYKSRFIRLFPIFWICVLLSSFVIIFFNIKINYQELSLPILLGNLTMIPRQFLGINSYIEGSYWTLECELFFYILISLIYFKIGKKYVIYTFIGLSFFGLIVHIFDITHNLSALPRIFQALFMRAYGILNIKHENLFLAGISLYLYRKTRRQLYCLVFIFAVFCSFFYVPDGLTFTDNNKILNGSIILAIGSLFWFSNLSVLKSLFLNKIFLFLGEISYPLYLIHQNLGRSITTIVSNLTYSASFGLFTGLVFVIAISVLLTFKVDIPLRKYLQKLT